MLQHNCQLSKVLQIKRQKQLGKAQGNIVVWVKISTLLRLGDLCCHGYDNKDLAKDKSSGWQETGTNGGLPC